MRNNLKKEEISQNHSLKRCLWHHLKWLHPVLESLLKHASFNVGNRPLLGPSHLWALLTHRRARCIDGSLSLAVCFSSWSQLPCHWQSHAQPSLMPAFQTFPPVMEGTLRGYVYPTWLHPSGPQLLGPGRTLQEEANHISPCSPPQYLQLDSGPLVSFCSSFELGVGNLSGCGGSYLHRWESK